MKLALIILILAWVFGCAARPPDAKTASVNPSQRVEIIHDRLVRNTSEIDKEIKAARKNPMEVMDRVTTIGVINSDTKQLVPELVKVGNGINAMQKRSDDLQKQNDESRQGFYRLLDYSSWLGALVLSIGLMLAITGKPWGIGIGVLGASMAGIFMIMGPAARVAVYVAAGMGAIAVLGVAYIVWWRISEWRRLRAEKLATKELVATVEVAKQHMDADTSVKVFGDPERGVTGAVERVQSPSTQAMVQEAKAALNGTA